MSRFVKSGTNIIPKVVEKKKEINMGNMFLEQTVAVCARGCWMGLKSLIWAGQLGRGSSLASLIFGNDRSTQKKSTDLSPAVSQLLVTP
jgi:hypothetical protein